MVDHYRWNMDYLPSIFDPNRSKVKVKTTSCAISLIKHFRHLQRFVTLCQLFGRHIIISSMVKRKDANSAAGAIHSNSSSPLRRIHNDRICQLSKNFLISFPKLSTRQCHFLSAPGLDSEMTNEGDLYDPNRIGVNFSSGVLTDDALGNIN